MATELAYFCPLRQQDKQYLFGWRMIRSETQTALHVMDSGWPGKLCLILSPVQTQIYIFATSKRTGPQTYFLPHNCSSVRLCLVWISVWKSQRAIVTDLGSAIQPQPHLFVCLTRAKPFSRSPRLRWYGARALGSIYNLAWEPTLSSCFQSSCRVEGGKEALSAGTLFSRRTRKKTHRALIAVFPGNARLASGFAENEGRWRELRENFDRGNAACQMLVTLYIFFPKRNHP